MKELLEDTAARAARYLTELDHRSVVPSLGTVARLQTLGGQLPENPSDSAEILALLDDIGSPATVCTAGRRYFGFVIGGSVPASLVANWLAGAWDQNACMQVMSPVAAKVEEIVRDWTLDLLGLPSSSGMGFVTCITTANFTALAPRDPRYCSAQDGTSRKTACSALRQFGWSWAKRYTFRC